MNDLVQRTLVDWLSEGPDTGPQHGLQRALAATRRTSQRPAWTFPERWLPMQLVLRPAVVPRPVILLFVVALLVAALAAAAVLVGSIRPRPAPPFGPAANGLIAYDAGRTVYIAQSDGSGARPIEGGLGIDWGATFSPDGTQIAFWSSPRLERRPSLFVADADGTGARQLGGEARLSGPDFVPPAWSPDGQSIAFSTRVPKQPAGIYVAPVDGSELRFVAPLGGYPAWSFDGEWIAFRSEADGRTKLSIAHPDGSGHRELISVEGRHDAYTHIAWSPDSTRLAYHRPQPDAPAVVSVFDLETGRETVVSQPGAGISSVPNWSSDSRRLAYFEEVDDGGGAYHQELVVIAADGTDRKVLGPVGGCAAYWSPDSQYLISFAEGCFGKKLAVIPADGSQPQTITMPGTITGVPSWQRLPPE